jgi:hypothetical protein
MRIGWNRAEMTPPPSSSRRSDAGAARSRSHLHRPSRRWVGRRRGTARHRAGAQAAHVPFRCSASSNTRRRGSRTQHGGTRKPAARVRVNLLCDGLIGADVAVARCAHDAFAGRTNISAPSGGSGAAPLRREPITVPGDLGAVRPCAQPSWSAQRPGAAHAGAGGTRRNRTGEPRRLRLPEEATLFLFISIRALH